MDIGFDDYLRTRGDTLRRFALWARLAQLTRAQRAVLVHRHRLDPFGRDVARLGR